MLARILEDGKIVATTDLAEVRAALKENKRVWIELERQSAEPDPLLADLEIHPLTIEDIYGSGPRPKVHDFPNYLYVILPGTGPTRRKKPDLAEVDVLPRANWPATY